MPNEKTSAQETPVEVLPKDSEKTGVGEKTIVRARDVYPEELLVIPAMTRPVFPRITVPVVLDSPEMIGALAERLKHQLRYVGVLLHRETSAVTAPEQETAATSFYTVGVLAEVMQVMQPAPNTLHVLLATHERFRVRTFVQEKPVLLARVEYLLEGDTSSSPEVKA